MSSTKDFEVLQDAVVVNEVSKFYGRIKALKDVSLRVKKGEIFGLIGANGAGKSTLIKILTGTSRPSAGHVEVLGLNPQKQAKLLRQNIGYMPQTSALYEDLSPFDNVLFFGKAHSITNLKGRVDEVIEFTNLKARAHDPVFGFSGGMKQRVSLACTLVHRPQILFLDEPTAGVDPKLREVFWKHFRDLATGGATVFISTHLMDEALLCDRLAIMRDGKVLVSDTPSRILESGETRIKVWQGKRVNLETTHNYPEQLPLLLQRYNLDSSITKIEIEQDSLESIVLELIDQNQKLETGKPKEVPDAAHA